MEVIGMKKTSSNGNDNIKTMVMIISKSHFGTRVLL